jgi:putative tricarboxylic transport membrane protein
MSSIEGLIYGLGVVFTYQNLLAAFVGALAGTAIGVLPGLGPVAGIAMIMPASYALGPTAGLVMMAGIYYGAMYGGSTTAILINMPGESASVMTAVDGYKLTQKGRAGAVLCIVAVGSFIGGTVSVVGVMLFAPLLAKLGILFGPAEFFALIGGGLLMLARVSGGSFAAGIFPMALGLMLSTVGQEAVTAQDRFTFGVNDLTQGVSLVALVVGVYGVAEIMSVVEDIANQPRPLKVRLRDMLPTREEWRRSWAPFGRGTVLGFIFGLLPGPSATLASFASYRLEKSVSKHRDEIGEGAIEGVAGPETANNAAATSSMVPLLGLGIPFGAVTALMLSAMMVHGVQPGPLLITTNPQIFWGVIASMYVGNVMLLILNVPLIGLWVSVLRVPKYVFLPVILLLATVGSYSVNNSMLDVYVLLVVGVIGYGLRKFDFKLAPLVVGLVLGPEIEKHMREGLYMSLGEPSVFWTSPIALGIWIAVALVMLAPLMNALLRRVLGRPAPAAKLVLEDE